MPSDATEAALGLLGLTTAFTNPLPPSSFSPSTIPTKRKQPATSSAHDDKPSNTDSIDCICGFTYDDGFSIACDKCARWCHAACFQIVENEIPDVWLCWRCDPRPVDKERAIKIQKARQRAATASANANKRRASPGVERKPRRPSGLAGDVGHGHTNKRKRRVSITAAAHAQQQAEDEHVDIDEPWQQTYVHITKDIVKSNDARDRLRRVASDWRGVTAISPSPTPLTPGCSTPALLTPDAIPSRPPITLQPLTNNPSFPSLFAHGNSSVRPPSYAVHATQPIQSSKLIAPYPSTIMSTAAYLADPLNAYAHLGMPKPFVHLIGPPLDVALDARFTGDQSRFVRSGCRPNAVIRPVVCHSKKTTAAEEDSLSFGIFALRDLKANEEVVLGWEWDDGNVVHHLPALIDSPFAFPPHEVHHYRTRMTSLLHALSSTFTTCACGAKARDCALARMAEFVENQTPLTPSPSPPSQFAKDKNANATKGKKADHGADDAPSATPVDFGPLIGIERGFRTRERIPFSGGMGGVEMVPPQTSETEAGPSREYAEPPGARQRKVSFPPDLLSPQVKARPAKGKDLKGKGRADEDDMTTEESDAGDAGKTTGRSRTRRRSSSSPQSDAMEVDNDAPMPEKKLPPRMRKTWIRETAERLREHRRHISESEDVKMDQVDSSFDSRDMPPPPVPPSRTPPLSTTSTNYSQFPSKTLSASTSNDSTSSSASSKHRRQLPDGFASPSTPFAKLSLDSPVASAPSAQSSQPHLPTRPQSPSHPQTEVSSSLPSSQPQPRKRKVTTSLQHPTESKEAKKPRVRTRKEKPKERVKDKDKHTGRDRDGAGVRTPSTPTTPSTPAKELDALPAVVRKESTAARRKKTASQSPRIVTKEVSPKESPRSAASALPSPAAVPAALPPPPPKQVVDVLEKPSTGTPTESAASSIAAIEAVSAPSPAASTLPSSEAPPTPPSPNPDHQQKETAVDIKERTSAPAPAPAEHASGSEPTPAAAPEAAANDVDMADARPGSPQPPAARQLSTSPAPPASSFSPLPQASRTPLPPAESLFDPDPLPQPASPPHPGPSEADAPSAQPPEHPEQRPAEPERPLTPPVPAPPPPPPKVKLSLKDFAQRKRKQREEEKEREKAEKERALASPCVDPPGLPAPAAEGGEHEGAGVGERTSDVAGAEPAPTPASDPAAEQEAVKKSEGAPAAGAEGDAAVALNDPSSEVKNVEAMMSDMTEGDRGHGQTAEVRRPHLDADGDVKMAESESKPEQDALMGVDVQPAVPPVDAAPRSPTPSPKEPSPVTSKPPVETDSSPPAEVHSFAPRVPSPEPGLVVEDPLPIERPRAASPAPHRELNGRTSPRDYPSIDSNIRSIDSYRAKVELLEDHVSNGFVVTPIRERSPYTSPRQRSITPIRPRSITPSRYRSVTPPRHRSITPQRHRSVTPPSQRSITPYGQHSYVPRSRGRSLTPPSRGRSPTPLRGRSRTPYSRGRSPTPPFRSRYVSPPPRDRFASPPARDRYVSPLARDRYVSPLPRDRYASPPGRDRYASPPIRDRYASPERDRFVSPPPRSHAPGYRQESRTPPPEPSPKLGELRGAVAPQASQEDGEILSPPPPKAAPLGPPTQPRSFYTAMSPPPRRSPPPVRRPLHPASYRNTSSARPLPSAPRALRTPGGGYGAPSHAYASGVQNAPYYSPRGPSGDRERERERGERERERERAPREWGRDRADSDRAWIPGPSRGRGRGWGR